MALMVGKKNFAAIMVKGFRFVRVALRARCLTGDLGRNRFGSLREMVDFVDPICERWCLVACG